MWQILILNLDEKGQKLKKYAEIVYIFAHECTCY